MSCVILIASVVPCKDAVTFDKKQTTAVKSATHQDCNGNTDECSPLCICNCCAACSIYYSSPQLPKSVLETSCQYSEFIPLSIHEVYLSIWEPPQL